MARSLQQQIQSRINGMGGGRPPTPANPHGLAAVRRIKERARKRGGASLDKCVRFWTELVGDKNVRTADRIRAAENLCDRFGFPRMNAVANFDETFETPKMVVFRRFDPPATELSQRTLDAHLANGLLRANVSDVMVSGHMVLEDGRATQVDEQEVRARAHERAHGGFGRDWVRLGPATPAGRFHEIRRSPGRVTRYLDGAITVS